MPVRYLKHEMTNMSQVRLFVCHFLPDLAEATHRPLVGQFVLPGEVQAPLLARDEGLGSGVGGPGLHPGQRPAADAEL